MKILALMYFYYTQTMHEYSTVYDRVLDITTGQLSSWLHFPAVAADCSRADQPASPAS